MSLENNEREKVFIPLVGFFALALLSASLFGFLATAILSLWKGTPISYFSSLSHYQNDAHASMYFKFMNTSFLLGFSVFPVLLYRLLDRDASLKLLLKWKPLQWKVLGYCIVAMLLTSFLVDGLNALTEPLISDWIANSEGYWKDLDKSMKDTYALTAKISGWQDWVISVLGMVVVPAFGEEWVFRGVLFRYLERMGLKPQAVVWISAVVFSAFHMHPSGFIGRVILGACLGYMVSKTRNIGYAIAAHGFNNLGALLFA